MPSKSKRFALIITQACTIIISLSLLATCCNFASASDGSIANLYVFPSDGGTYESVNQVVYQLTAVNTNTTVSVSIDGRPPTPMNYTGEVKEIVNGEDSSQDWYQWQITIPSISDPGKHTLQFFSHYYVWQETDQYWAEFNARSDIKSFNIVSAAASSQNPPESIPIVIMRMLASAALLIILILLALAKFRT